ncbi:MAG: acetylglutamate kinase [Phycisphaeraceae bacterium]|nr:acetylglutamate kinase [Phycisphaeraceae bacterium]
MTAPIVVKIGGRALDEAASRGPLWNALACLAREHDGGVVVVHGGGAAVDAHLARLGMFSARAHGLRITPPEHMDEVAAVLAGRVNTLLVGLLLAAGANAVGLRLGDARAARCDLHRRAGTDLGRVGEVTRGEGGVWRALLHAGCTPVISSIGFDERGCALNVNADDAAAAVARILHAHALVLLTDVPGVRGPDGGTIAECDAARAEALIDAGVITGGMIPKARAAAATAETTGVPTVIASWDAPERLRNLTHDASVGTRFTTEAQRAMRSALAADDRG